MASNMPNVLRRLAELRIVAPLHDESGTEAAILCEAAEMIEFMEKDVEILVCERNQARCGYERAIKTLSGIHALLHPPVTQANGKTYTFKSPFLDEQVQALSDRIREIPSELEAAAEAMKP